MKTAKPHWKRNKQKAPFASFLSLVLLLPGIVAIAGCQKKETPPQKDSFDIKEATTLADAKKRKKVLLVQSYHTGYPWVDAITRGVRMALSDTDAELQVFYMDTKRKTTEAWKRQVGNEAQNVMNDWKPDVVIAADDNAQQYFAKDFVGKSHPQFVFCGVNARPQKYGYPASNVTGILERPHLNASLALLHKLKPEAKRIAIITDDSPTSAGALGFMTSLPKPFEIVSIKTPSTFVDWKQAVKQAQNDADAIAIYMYHTVKDHSDADSMEPRKVIFWTVNTSEIPIIAFFIFAVDDGALCGYLESGLEHGFKAGQMAKQILEGKSAGDIPMITALEGQSMLNLITARKLGINVPREIVKTTDVVIGKKK